MLVPTIKVRILAGSICLLLPVICDSMLSASAAQSSNDNTNPVLKAIQEAFLTDGGYLKAKVTVKDFELNADVPITSELISKGLAVKNQLKENEAMLFIFEESAKHSFWMKDMKFPIDIIWLDSASKVVHIERNLQPCASVFICPGYRPSADSQYVLETVAGFAQRHNVNIGSDIDFELVR
ncbi:MAG TPA: DUF192 domain-containing protein [Nitrososphaeraceae archaeon]|nr:DUF192 domain-containing protein [Nitrososphaeraceae archaeon]